MRGFAPRTLLSAQGLHAKNDSHARDGYHIRVYPSALLGLPIAPLLVYRIRFDKPQWRQDVVWIDSHGRVLTPPFDVTAGSPVHGYLPPAYHGACGWFVMEGNVLGSASLTIEAQVMTPRGWASVAARSAAPWVVTATPIERVTVSGSGRVERARWIDLTRLPDNIDNAIAQLHLPVQQGRRYQAVAGDAYAYALGQATRIAPTRRALQEVPWVADPFAAPPWTADQEGDRVEALAADLVADLQALTDDTARQLDVRSEHPIEAGVPGGGTMSRPLLAGVLAAAQDPGIARFLGLLTWDDFPPFQKTMVHPYNGLVYHVLGYWEVEERDGEYGVVQTLSAAEQLEQGRADIFWPLPTEVRVFKRKQGLKDELRSRGLKAPPGELGPVALLFTSVVVLAEDPMPDVPSVPAITAIGPTDPPWQPGTAPAARRRVAISLGGLVPGAGLAFARRSEALPLWRPLNPPVDRWHTLIVPGAPATADEPGHGELGDRDAPPVEADYRLAQADSFGRWSAWATGEIAAGVRPPPPRPVIEATFTPAPLPDQPTDLPLAGTIRVSVAVPKPASLPPGAYLLDRVRILFDSVEVESRAPGSEPTVVVTPPGPPLAPTARQTVRVSAFWVDTAGQSSAESLPVSLNCYDLRTPPQVVMPNGLQYASRADATGHCRAEIAWPVLAGQSRFRVYVAHETTLRAQLEALGETALLAELDGMSPPDRAVRLRENHPLFPRNLFELLTDTPIEVTGTSARFEHALSGSLAGLSFYRVVAVADTNVEAPFEEADLLPVAVPNSPAPARPSLEIASVNVPLADGRSVPGIRVRITMPAGLRPAVEYRLSRSTEETRDVRRMPLVASGALPAESAVPGQAQVHTVLLVGDPSPGTPDPTVAGPYDETLPADIRIWMRYHFRADVRAAPEPGSDVEGMRLVPGEWSAAALPVAVLVLAPEPPAPATGLEFVSTENLLRWRHAEVLLGRHAGTYVFDIYRMVPGERETWLASVAGDAAGQGGRNPDGSGYFQVKDLRPPAGTRYRVVLSDPLGRPSPIAELTLPV
jgi:hypothetical protein